MKSSRFARLALATAFVALATGAVHAGGGHAHGPRHVGVVRTLHDVSYELVAKPESLTLYVSDHGKPIPTAGVAAEAVIQAGNETRTVKLEPAGENRLVAAGSFRVGLGVRVVVTTTLPGKPPARAVFNLK